LSERKALPKAVRFEVLKRDSFTCQYCGAKAPDVVLQIDHIEPVSLGGSDSLLNLATSCAACNGGKGARRLDDASVVEKQRQQLAQLQERREQIDMLVEWQKGLGNLDDYATEKAAEFWRELAPGWTLTDTGTKKLRAVLRRFGLDEVIAAMRVAANTYLVFEGDPPRVTNESWGVAFDKIGGVCSTTRKERDNPNLRRLYYIRGILRKRWMYCKEHLVLREMQEAIDRGVSIEQLEDMSKGTTYWTQWRGLLDDLILDAEERTR
jgi:hypothetical protein